MCEVKTQHSSYYAFTPHSGSFDGLAIPQKLKVALRKRIQQLVADWPEIIGMHGNSSARSVWAFLRGLKSGVREPPPHGKPFHLSCGQYTVGTPHMGSVCSGRFHRAVMLPA